MRRGIVLIATWWGLGNTPKAPGTAGTLGAIPLVIILSYFPLGIYLLFTLCLGLLACWVAGQADIILGGQDSQVIVIDEVVGFLVAMAVMPVSWVSILICFILFRAFDIIKPFPIRLLEHRVKGGYGVVLDDVLAGVYAFIIMRIVFTLFLFIA